MTNACKQYDRIAGALYGFAIGDAIGATTEFMNKDQIKKLFGEIKGITGGGWLRLVPGMTTDDTDMMVCVGKAYRLEKGKLFDLLRYGDNCCRLFENWYASDPVDVGNTCRNAIVTCKGQPSTEWLRRSEAINLNGQKTYGNGGLMRSLYPVLKRDLKAAIYQSRLTHNNPTCDKAIKDYGLMMAMALDGKMYDWTSVIEHLEPTGHVVNTLNNAYYWYHHSKSFEEAVLACANDGGDADTIGALCGGLAGALYGLSGIPEKWVKELEKGSRNEIRALISAF